jgi:hypothetical protein
MWTLAYTLSVTQDFCSYDYMILSITIKSQSSAKKGYPDFPSAMFSGYIVKDCYITHVKVMKNYPGQGQRLCFDPGTTEYVSTKCQ